MTPRAFPVTPPKWPHDVARRDLALDRARWGDGPWQSEPDLIGWQIHGLPCAIARNDMGCLRGYAGVTPEHPLFGVEFGALDRDAPAHCGLNFSGAHDELEAHGLFERGTWLFGFDCGHWKDYTPGLNHLLGHDPMAPTIPHGVLEQLGATYRDVDYVRRVVELLAAWLAEAPAKLDALIARALETTERNQD